MSAEKGFMASLFDFSFETFVFPRVIRFVFAVLVVLAGIATLGVIVAGFARGSLPGIGALILSPIVFFLYVLAARIWTEIAIVLFRIHDNTDIIARKQG